MTPHLAKRDASSRSLEQGLVTDIPVQVQGGSQFCLVKHHDVRSLLADQPVQDLLFIHRVDPSHIPHEY